MRAVIRHAGMLASKRQPLPVRVCVSDLNLENGGQHFFFKKKKQERGRHPPAQTCSVQIGYFSREDHPLTVKSGFHVKKKKTIPASGVRREQTSVPV